MKKTTLHHMAMYQNVLAVVKDHQTSWISIPAIVTVVSEFETLLNNLGSRLNGQNSITQGISEEKQQYLNQLVSSMSLLKKGLFLYATQTSDPVLRARHKESLTKLKSIGADRLMIRTATLLEDLETHGTALQDFGITAVQIQEFQSLAALLEERKNSVRQAIIERSLETKSIRDLEKQLNKLLIEQLDRFISLFQSSNNLFYETYKAARRIIGKSGGPGSSIKGLTTT